MYGVPALYKCTFKPQPIFAGYIRILVFTCAYIHEIRVNNTCIILYIRARVRKGLRYMCISAKQTSQDILHQTGHFCGDLLRTTDKIQANKITKKKSWGKIAVSANVKKLSSVCMRWLWGYFQMEQANHASTSCYEVLYEELKCNNFGRSKSS